MMALSMIFFAIAAIVHLFIFYMESIAWGTEKANKVFRLTQESAKDQKLFAYNQGFYNLFLAIQVIVGLIIMQQSQSTLMGKTLCLAGSASMVGAAIVLFTSAPHLKRAVLIQGLPPLIGIIFHFL
jgi:putative membrane protein